MTYGYIYKIEFPNGKHYIGLTCSLKQRKRTHKQYAKYGDTRKVYNALRKYDMVDNFELIEIDTAETNEELCEKEIEYIQKYNSYYLDGGNGYNMTLGGDGCNGYVFTEEVKQKISEARKLYFEEHPEAIEIMRKAQKKRFEDPEERQKSSEKMKKHFENPEAIEIMRKAQKKRFEDPEERQKISEARKLYFENTEAIEKHRQSQKKYFENPEAIKKNSEAQKKHHIENPQRRKEHSEKMTNHYKNNPDAGKEHSEKMKKRFENNPEARKKILDTKGQNKQFDIFTKDGTFVKSFSYHFEAKEYLQREYNITSTIKICEVLNGNRKSSAGFVFKYK